MVSTHNETKVLSALDQILQPLKSLEQVGSRAQIETQFRRKTLEELQTEYLLYLQDEPLPDPESVEYFTRRIAQLEWELKPLKVVQNPLPGELAVGGPCGARRWPAPAGN